MNEKQKHPILQFSNDENDLIVNFDVGINSFDSISGVPIMRKR